MARLPGIGSVRWPKLNTSVRLPSGGNVFFNAQGFAVFDKSVLRTNWKAINKGPLKRAGLLTRKIMRRSIRRVKTNEKRLQDLQSGKTKSLRRGKPSKPGQPPRSRTERYGGHPFKKIFSLPFTKQSYVVGHVGWGGVPTTPMEAHEFGKTVSVKTVVYPKKKRGKRRSAKQRQSSRRAFLSGKLKSQKSQVKIVTKTVKMPKRPFARPALEKARPYFAAMWKDSLNKTVGAVHN